jgi:hypothetical protein
MARLTQHLSYVGALSFLQSKRKITNNSAWPPRSCLNGPAIGKHSTAHFLWLTKQDVMLFDLAIPGQWRLCISRLGALRAESAISIVRGDISRSDENSFRIQQMCISARLSI